MILPVQFLLILMILVFDSWGHFPSGFMEGTYGSLGDFDECLDVVPDSGSHINFVGQYCTPRFELPFDTIYKQSNDTLYRETMNTFSNLKSPVISNAFCIPSVCTPNDLKSILDEGNLNIETNKLL